MSRVDVLQATHETILGYLPPAQSIKDEALRIEHNAIPDLLAVVRTAEAWQEKLAATGGFIADHPAAWALYDEFIEALSAFREPTS